MAHFESLVDFDIPVPAPLAHTHGSESVRVLEIPHTMPNTLTGKVVGLIMMIEAYCMYLDLPMPVERTKIRPNTIKCEQIVYATTNRKEKLYTIMTIHADMETARLTALEHVYTWLEARFTQKVVYSNQTSCTNPTNATSPHSHALTQQSLSKEDERPLIFDWIVRWPNPIAILNNFCQNTPQVKMPYYNKVPAHRNSFAYQCTYAHFVVTGVGTDKRSAKHNAANAMLTMLAKCGIYTIYTDK